jgi:2-hydroxychromene-2-carboxylate isomerase
VQRLFRFVWAEGCSADDPGQWQRLLEELGMQDAEEQLAADKVKNQLRENSESAIETGVFGVPAFVLDGEVFWGFDSIDFLLACVEDPELLESAQMLAADNMPEGAQRQR